jgi:hypothetical protein
MATDDDDDILIPRRLHSAANGSPANENIADLSIDPEMLERRGKRKQALHPQASAGAVNEEPWGHLDRGLAARIPAFNEPMWTLGDVARWVVERTAQAVDGLSIDEEKLPEALTEIHDALSRAQITAWRRPLSIRCPANSPLQRGRSTYSRSKRKTDCFTSSPFTLRGQSTSDRSGIFVSRASRCDVIGQVPNRTRYHRPRR